MILMILIGKLRKIKIILRHSFHFNCTSQNDLHFTSVFGCIVVIPPYGSRPYMGYLVYCFFLCTVTDFSAAEKDRCVKFCMLVRLLSGQVFSPFGELWLAGSHTHSGRITSGMYAPTQTFKFTLGAAAATLSRNSVPWLGGAFGIGGGGVA